MIGVSRPTLCRLVMADAQPTDLVKAERGGTLYQLEVQSLANLLDTDLIEVERGGVVYQETGANVKADLPTGPGYDPDAQDYITRVETADGEALETAVKDAINQLFLDVKAEPTLWNNISWMYLSCGPRTIQGISLCAYPNTVGDMVPQSVVQGDYDRIGIQGDGVSKFFIAPFDADLNTTQMYAYMLDGFNAANVALMGSFADSAQLSYYCTHRANNSGEIQVRLRSTGANWASFTMPNAGALSYAPVTGSTLTDLRVISVSSNLVFAQGGSSPSQYNSTTGDFYIMARNDLGAGQVNQHSWHKLSGFIFCQSNANTFAAQRAATLALENYRNAVIAALP